MGLRHGRNASSHDEWAFLSEAGREGAVRRTRGRVRSPGRKISVVSLKYLYMKSGNGVPPLFARLSIVPQRRDAAATLRYV